MHHQGAGDVAVERLIGLTQERRAATRDMLDWLRVEFAVGSPGQRLEALASLDEDAFLQEVRQRRPVSSGALGPAEVGLLHLPGAPLVFLSFFFPLFK
jgi:hypothetical protein